MILSNFFKKAGIFFLPGLLSCSAFAEDFSNLRSYSFKSIKSPALERRIEQEKEIDFVKSTHSKNLFAERLSYNTTNNLTSLHFLEYMMDAEKERNLVEDKAAEKMKRMIETSVKQTLRESLLDSITLDDYIIGGFGEKIKDMFKAREEKNTLVSPFNKDEGLPGFERFELSRLPKKWDWGARPFRTHPYGFLTGKIGDSRIHLRTGLEDLEITWQKPVINKLNFTAGYKSEWKNEEIGYGFLGVEGYLFDGIFSAGASFNGAGAGFALGYLKQF